eukprot:scaffold76808_cov66-Phaeocystis_antarctica.AAC.5
MQAPFLCFTIIYFLKERHIDKAYIWDGGSCDTCGAVSATGYLRLGELSTRSAALLAFARVWTGGASSARRHLAPSR